MIFLMLLGRLKGGGHLNDVASLVSTRLIGLIRIQ